MSTELTPDNSKYCIKQIMFFAADVTIEDNLSKEQADMLCEKYNNDELDKLYTWYEVHISNIKQ